MYGGTWMDVNARLRLFAIDLREVETEFEDRILPVDGAVADRWGRLAAERPVPTIDGLLATALVHGLTLATRNERDIVKTGAPCVTPFETR